MPPHAHDGRCKEILEMLSGYLNLELPADACQAIDTHLAGCAPCDRFAESLRSTVELCRRYQANEMPAPLSEKARQELLSAYDTMLSAIRKP